MDEDQRHAMQDVVALLSVLVFVLGIGLGLFLCVFYKVGPAVFGPADQPLTSVWLVIPFFVTFAALFTLGGFCGGTLWLIVMSRFLPKRTLHKWLTFGPQIQPLLKFNLRLLDRLYSQN